MTRVGAAAAFAGGALVVLGSLAGKFCAWLGILTQHTVEHKAAQKQRQIHRVLDRVLKGMLMGLLINKMTML
jgi:hypothetical protein